MRLRSFCLVVAALYWLQPMAHADVEYIMSENAPAANGQIPSGVVISPHGRTSLPEPGPADTLPAAPQVATAGSLPLASSAESFVSEAATDGMTDAKVGPCPIAAAAGLTAEQMIVRDSPVDQWGSKLFHVSVDDSQYHGEAPAMIPAGWGGAALDRWYAAQEKVQQQADHHTTGLSCAAEIAAAFSATRSYWVTFGGALQESAGGDPSALAKLSDAQRSQHQRKYTLLEVRMIKRNLKPITSPALISYFSSDQKSSRAFFADLLDAKNSELVSQ